MRETRPRTNIYESNETPEKAIAQMIVTHIRFGKGLPIKMYSSNSVIMKANTQTATLSCHAVRQLPLMILFKINVTMLAISVINMNGIRKDIKVSK